MRLSPKLKGIIQDKLIEHANDYVWQAGFRAGIDLLDDYESEIQFDQEDQSLHKNESATSDGPTTIQKTIEKLLEEMDKRNKSIDEDHLSETTQPSLVISEISSDLTEKECLEDGNKATPKEERASQKKETPTESEQANDSSTQERDEKFQSIENQSHEEEEWGDEDEDPDA